MKAFPGPLTDTDGGGGGGGPALGSGGGAEGRGGGPEGTGGAWGVNTDSEDCVLSKEPSELMELDFKWPSFRGLDGGIFGTLRDAEGRDDGTCGTAEGKGGAAEGKGGAADGKGGGPEEVGGVSNEGAAEEAVIRFRFGGLVSGVCGACGAECCGRDTGCIGGTGILGAEAGTRPLRLSFTLLSLGIPPAKISPNWGGPPDGNGGALDV